MKNLKKIFVFVLLAGFCTLSAQKVAYVKEVAILKSIKDYEKNINYIDSLGKEMKIELSKSEKEISDKAEKLIKNYKIPVGEDIKSKLKPADLEKLNLYEKEFELLKEKMKNNETKINDLYNSMILPELTKVNEVIANYAKKKKIQIVYKLESSSNMAYIDSNLDVTEEIIKLMN